MMDLGKSRFELQSLRNGKLVKAHADSIKIVIEHVEIVEQAKCNLKMDDVDEMNGDVEGGKTKEQHMVVRAGKLVHAGDLCWSERRWQPH